MVEITIKSKDDLRKLVGMRIEDVRIGDNPPWVSLTLSNPGADKPVVLRITGGATTHVIMPPMPPPEVRITATLNLTTEDKE
ncbi:MAG: hypothetical protein PHQ43_00075 [Dehalococcoidales bacterium]|nr:hypothetical protein [Dehalococcoidales bacterium]